MFTRALRHRQAYLAESKSLTEGALINHENIIHSNGRCGQGAVALASGPCLKTDPTQISDPDFLIIGDLNAYAMASPSIAGQVTGVTTWHINADEPSVLDYSEEDNPTGQITSLSSDDPYRSSAYNPGAYKTWGRSNTTPDNEVCFLSARTVSRKEYFFRCRVSGSPADRMHRVGHMTAAVHARIWWANARQCKTSHTRRRPLRLRVFALRFRCAIPQPGACLRANVQHGVPIHLRLDWANKGFADLFALAASPCC